ncbi:MAG: nucleoside 2-deoxyribosyltransferase, partial [Dehalococcoidales bacterium]
GRTDKYGDISIMASPSGIVTRDHNDIKNCDAMVACFLGYDKVSIGSMVEFGLAHAYRKPIVCVMEPKNIHQHSFVLEIAGYVTDDLAEAAHIITTLVTPSL